jgi:chorismate mutase
MNKLDIYRNEIDALDGRLLEILFKRLSVVKKIGIFKRAHNLPALNSMRKSAVLEKFKAACAEHGMPPRLGAQLYKIIHEYSVKLERESK